MTEYYFLASLLPELIIGHVPTLNFRDLRDLLRINITKTDLRKVKIFLRLIDLDNMRSLWAGEPIEPRGNLNEKELKEALRDFQWSEKEPFPDYMEAYLKKHPEDADRAANYSRLVSRFLEEEGEAQEGFLGAYFRFEKEWRLVMTGFRAKKQGRDIVKELQFEDPNDPIVAQILAQKDAKVYEPPFEYKELKSIFERYDTEPLELQKALLEYRFAEIIGITGGALFSVDRILGYMARLLLCERWIELDMQKGIQIIDDIVKAVK